MPTFKEESQETLAGRLSSFGVTFVDCQEVVDAFLRAFGTWASNHPLINFKDVSEACEQEGLGPNCTHAEVYIVAHEPDTLEQQNFAAYVTPLPSRCSVEEVYGAGELPYHCGWGSGRGRRTTAGVTVADDYAIAYAHMVFNTQARHAHGMAWHTRGACTHMAHGTWHMACRCHAHSVCTRCTRRTHRRHVSADVPG